MTSEMPMTGNPASARALAVPPVDTSSQPARGQRRGERDEPSLVRNAQEARMIAFRASYALHWIQTS